MNLYSLAQKCKPLFKCKALLRCWLLSRKYRQLGKALTNLYLRRKVQGFTLLLVYHNQLYKDDKIIQIPPGVIRWAKKHFLYLHYTKQCLLYLKWSPNIPLKSQQILSAVRIQSKLGNITHS